MLTIVDDATHWCDMLCLKSKDDAYTEYIKWTTEIYTQHGIKIKNLQSNNNAVFLS